MYSPEILNSHSVEGILVQPNAEQDFLSQNVTTIICELEIHCEIGYVTINLTP